MDTVPSAHSRSLASVRFLPQTYTPLRVGAKCGRPHQGSNRALITGTSVWFHRFRPLGHGGDKLLTPNLSRLLLVVDKNIKQVQKFVNNDYESISVIVLLRSKMLFSGGQNGQIFEFFSQMANITSETPNISGTIKAVEKI